MTVERTLAVIKPDATARPIVGDIIGMAEAAGLSVVEARMETFPVGTMESLYAEHAGRHYYDEQVAYMVSGTSLAMVLEGVDAVAKWRAVMGPTDHTKAPKGTVRGEWGESYRRNCVHGSDSVENALREIDLFFPGKAS